MYRSLFLICGSLLLCTNAEDNIQAHPRRIKRQLTLANDPSLWIQLKLAGLGIPQVRNPPLVVQAVRTKFAQARANHQVALARRESNKLAAARAFVQRAAAAQNAVVGVQAAQARSAHSEAARRVGAARRASINFAAARNDVAARTSAIQNAAARRNGNLFSNLVAPAKSLISRASSRSRTAEPRVYSVQGETRTSCASCLLKRGRLPNCQISCKVFQSKMNELFGSNKFK